MGKLPTVFLFFTLHRDCQTLLWINSVGSIGGTELQIRLIAEKIVSPLVVISGKIEDGKKNIFLRDLEERKIPYIYLGSRRFFIYIAAHFLRKIAPNAKICHFFNPGSSRFAPVVKKQGFQIFYMETGMPKNEKGWKVLRKVVRYFDLVTSVSQAGLDALNSLFGYQGPSLLIPTLIEPFSRKQAAPTSPFHVVYFGRMTPKKGVYMLISVFLRILKYHPQAKLTMIGSGELFVSLKTEFSSESIEFTGWIQREELELRLSQASVMCLPSEDEGLPGSILEAMSLGLPILATDVGGIPEVIEHRKTGLLISPKDEEALFSSLMELANDPNFRENLGNGAFKKWKEMENSSALYQKMVNFIPKKYEFISSDENNSF
jgi:glycosyltransferase involved in cell wall biosynthesis